MLVVLTHVFYSFMGKSGGPLTQILYSRKFKNLLKIVIFALIPITTIFQNCVAQKFTTEGSQNSTSTENSDSESPPNGGPYPPPPTTVPPTNGIAEFPRAYVDTTIPLQTGTTFSLAAGGNLQTALNNAAPGDTIILAAEATFKGNFTLPYKSNPQNKWIIIKSSQLNNLPVVGKRVSPSQSHLMPKIISNGVEPAISANKSAGYYRFIGVEVTDSGEASSCCGPDLPGGGKGGFSYGLIELGQLGRDTSLSDLPHHIIFDRSYIHGQPNSHVKYGVSMDGAHQAIIDSYISSIKGISQDTQAIRSFHGQVLKINNNFLEGAGENVMLGGADPSISGIVPSDIEIRKNYIYKPLSWKIGHATYGGIPWLVKNLFETKACQRLLFEANILENSWPHGQTGFAFVLKSSNQDGNCAWCVSQDLTIRYNIIKNSTNGSSIHTLDEYSGGGGIPQRRVSIIHNIFENIGYRMFQITGPSSQGPQQNIEIINNTAWDNDNEGDYPSYINMGDGPGAIVMGLKIQNNLFYQPGTPASVMGSGQAWGLASLNVFSSNHNVKGNVFMRPSNEGSNSIPNNIYIDRSMAGLKNPTAGDYELLPSSSLKGLGYEGSDPGANISLVRSITSMTISGQ